MTLEKYEALKRERLQSAWQPRSTCAQCKRPPVACYCPLLKPFVSFPEFVILMHPAESRRGIATGRMSHLSVSNSRLIEGEVFTHHAGVNEILADTSLHPVLLYPAFTAVNLSDIEPEERRALFPKNKRLVIFVLDGTWNQARRMRWRSKNLLALPNIRFTPPKASGFLVRKQPRPHCYSTIESIHHIIDLFGSGQEHHALLDAFSTMVRRQLALRRTGGTANV